MAEPVQWRDVFDEIEQTVDTVATVLADKRCDVPVGEIRYDLSETCAARELVEVQIAVDVCSNVDGDGTYWQAVATDKWDIEHRGIGHYLVRVWPEHRLHLLDELDTSASNQEMYWKSRQAIEEAISRTEWVLTKCSSIAAALPKEYRLGSRGTRSLMARAARLGDEFALSSYPDTSHVDPVDGRHLIRLLESRPLEAMTRLAIWIPALVDHVLREFQSDREVAVDAELLDFAEMGIEPGKSFAEIERILRRRAEFLSLTYVLAVDQLTKASETEVDLVLLHKLAGGEPRYLDDNDYNLAKFEAEELVAQYSKL